MKQFEISNSVRRVLCDYLNMHDLDPKAVMDNETIGGEVAAIIHAGLPTMARRIYPLEKMKIFFWVKKGLMMGFVNMRLAVGDKKGRSRFKQWAGGDRSLKCELLFSQKLCQGQGVLIVPNKF